MLYDYGKLVVDIKSQSRQSGIIEYGSPYLESIKKIVNIYDGDSIEVNV